MKWLTCIVAPAFLLLALTSTAAAQIRINGGYGDIAAADPNCALDLRVGDEFTFVVDGTGSLTLTNKGNNLSMTFPGSWKVNHPDGRCQWIGSIITTVHGLETFWITLWPGAMGTGGPIEVGYINDDGDLAVAVGPSEGII